MTHLNETQLEDLLAGQPEPQAAQHAETCDACRARLDEARATRERLRSTFAGATASAALRARVQAAMGAEAALGRQPHRPHRPHVRILGLPVNRWSGLAAAAVLALAVLVPLAMQLAKPGTALATQEFAALHGRNLERHAAGSMFASEQPGAIAEHLKGRLGFAPAMPADTETAAVCACCVQSFKGNAAATYLVRTPQGVLSVVVIRDPPDALGLPDRHERGGKTYWSDTSAACRVAAVRLGEHTYCAVGQVPVESLVDVLAKLALPEE